MNLKTGNTIWLNASPKLIKNKKWLNLPFEKIPKDIQIEMEHHSHTHTNATVTSSAVTHNHNIETRYLTQLLKCGYGSAAYHSHNCPTDDKDSHSHSITVSFGSSSLGSPWSNHTHTVSLVTCGAGGAAHTHSGVPAANKCTACSPATLHTHGTGTIATTSGGSSHTNHTVSGTTGTANAGGTAESHTHNFSLTTGYGNDHNHASWGGTSGSIACARGYSHTHNCPTGSLDYASHAHTISGTSGSGGESAAAKTDRFFQMF